MQRHAELEIVLRWRKPGDTFDVSVAYDEPSDDQDRLDLVDEPITIDTDELSTLVAGEEDYGLKLSELIFGNQAVKTIYDRAVGATTASDTPLHLRLLIDPRAPMKYHSIRWESLRDVPAGQPVATAPNLYFSRYLSARDWRTVRPTRWDRLRALVVVANPGNLGEKVRVGMPEVPLDPIDSAAEVQRARDALSGVEGVEVVELAQRGRATLRKILAELSTGIDVLYLVCHGAFTGDTALLYLEDEDGRSDVVEAGLLARGIAELERPPTVALLCSCQSAGAGDDGLTSDGGALAAAGPSLSSAGVAAVIAMQGNVSMRTAQLFIPTFFDELQKHGGVVDQAMAVARRTIRGRERDWWMPVLYTRLRRGRAWYQPEFGEENDATFAAIKTQITMQSCTPIIGSGVAAEGILPSREQLAAAWADRWLIPLAEQSRVDLAKVSQYLSVYLASGQPRTELRHHLRTILLNELGGPPADMDTERTEVGPLVSAFGARHRMEQPEQDPFVALAALRLPVYITTSWTELLEDALKDVGRTPTTLYFDWHQKRMNRASKSRAAHDDFDPSPKYPLVYHLFGGIDDEASLVIGEDDYFAWMTEWIRRVDRDPSIPDCVRQALTNNSLLFLGYQLDDWEFHVLFQAIKSFEGVRLRAKPHVGVQLSPESNAFEPEAAQDYLRRYFDEDRVNVYWGTCQAFLSELSRRVGG